MRFDDAERSYGEAQLYEALRQAVLDVGGTFHDAVGRANVVGVRGLEHREEASAGPFRQLVRHEHWFDVDRYPEHLGLAGVEVRGLHEGNPRRLRLAGSYPGLFPTQDVIIRDAQDRPLATSAIAVNDTVQGETVLTLGATFTAEALTGATLSFRGYEADAYDDVVAVCYRFLPEGETDEGQATKRVRIYQATTERSKVGWDSSIIGAQAQYRYYRGVHRSGTNVAHHALRPHHQTADLCNWWATSVVGARTREDDPHRVGINVHWGVYPDHDYDTEPDEASAGCLVFCEETAYDEFIRFFAFNGVGRFNGSVDLVDAAVTRNGGQVVDHDPEVLVTLLTVDYLEARLGGAVSLPLVHAADPADPVNVALHYAASEGHLNFFPITAYGWWHNGIHLHGSEPGQRQLCAMFDGEVIAARLSAKLRDDSSPNFVLLQHQRGAATFYSLYLHLERVGFPDGTGERDEDFAVQAHEIPWMRRSWYDEAGAIQHEGLEKAFRRVKELKHPVRVEAGELLAHMGTAREAYAMEDSLITEEAVQHLCHLEVFSLLEENEGYSVYHQLGVAADKLVLEDGDQDVYAEYGEPRIYADRSGDAAPLEAVRDYLSEHLPHSAYEFEAAQRIFFDIPLGWDGMVLFHDEVEELMQRHGEAMRCVLAKHISTWAALEHPTTRVNHVDGEEISERLKKNAFLKQMSIFADAGEDFARFRSPEVYFYHPIKLVELLTPPPAAAEGELRAAAPAVDEGAVPYDAVLAAAYAEDHDLRAYGEGPEENPFGDLPGGNNGHFVSQSILAGFVGSADAATVFARRQEFEADLGQPLAWWHTHETWVDPQALYEYVQASPRGPQVGPQFELVTRDSAREYLDVGRVRAGDVVFMDLPPDLQPDEGFQPDGRMEAVLFVVANTGGGDYDALEVRFQSAPSLGSGKLGEINRRFHQRALFVVYRPLQYRREGEEHGAGAAKPTPGGSRRFYLESGDEETDLSHALLATAANQGALIHTARDGVEESFAYIVHFNGRYGMATSYTDHPRPRPSPDVAQGSRAQVVAAVSQNEGSFVDTQAYDNAVLTTGVSQWTQGSGNLQGLLGAYQAQQPALFARYFQAEGVDLVGGRITVDGTPLLQRETSLRVAYCCWKAGYDPAIQQVQLERMGERIDAFYPAHTHCPDLSRYYTSERALAHLLDLHVNRPAYVGHVAQLGIDDFLAVHPERQDPDAWGDADEAELLELFLARRHGFSAYDSTPMTNSAARAQTIAGIAALSPARNSYRP